MTGLRDVHALGGLLEVRTCLAAAYDDRPTEAELCHLMVVRVLTAARRVLDPQQFRAFLDGWEELLDDPAVLDELPEVEAPVSWPTLLSGLLTRFGREEPATAG